MIMERIVPTLCIVFVVLSCILQEGCSQTQDEKKKKGVGKEGGGGGDPHFMLRIDSLDFPVCFDIDAVEGDVIRMLKDPISGITINGGIVSSNQKKADGSFKTFIGELYLQTHNAQIHIKPDDITFNGASLSWNEEHVFEMNNIKIQFNRNRRHGNIMHLELGNDVAIEIRRLMKEDTGLNVNYLNMNIDKETGISDKAGGILGQFVHKRTTLKKITIDSQGRKRGLFREIENGHKTHFKAILHQQPDVITTEMVWCWNVHRRTEGLLDGQLSDYFVSDITSA
ncbi:inter-alpha-trypsin inhibitor heavy chain H2-like [Mytilus trossulus]|uniref:inter-alpha-trypsin inhibitor heavy chain H2-like n=1 Tax=Mytilus trossulus TaxID=6551 RepID=UPI00300659E0